jgi:hypothetical protein
VSLSEQRPGCQVLSGLSSCSKLATFNEWFVAGQKPHSLLLLGRSQKTLGHHVALTANIGYRLGG